MQEATHDELAGVVDLFEALTRAELEQALVELAFRQGSAVREEAVAAAVEEAVREYYLVPLPANAVTGAVDSGKVLIVGPVAFPMLPPDGEDLPHILEVPTRAVNREAAAWTVAARLREDAAAAIEADDTERASHLADVTYDLEAWGPVDLEELRAELLAVAD